jgi:hypothetical protein
LTFHLQTDKDIKFGHVVKHGVESGVFSGVEFGVIFGVIFGVDFKFKIALIIYITIQNRHKKRNNELKIVEVLT